jgi:LDH2 family malate/lactate/ureidoglycolate dehydrogenase
MSQTNQDITVKADPLRKFASTLYQKAGLSKKDAQTMAELQVETDLRGVHSHGTRALPWYVKSILDGKINPKPKTKIVREGPAFAVVDGDNGLGHPPSALAMQTAIEKAKTAGIGAAGVRNAGHYGAAACYTMMAVEEKMIGFSTTNTGAASVSAPGSAQAVVANNPLSYALPAGEERPIVLDMACAVSSWGKVKTMEMYGKPVPADWLLTAEGKPTTDPKEGKILTPAAGPRGYGLALIMGILAGPLVGGLMAINKRDLLSEHFFLAINVSSFTDYNEFILEVERSVRTIKAAKTAEGVDQVFLPGEIEWRNREKWIDDGIPLHADHLQSLADLAKELDVKPFWL